MPAEGWFSPAAMAAFEALFLPWMRRRIRAVRIAGFPDPPIPADQPILLVANHVSWWDGFVLRELQRRLRPRAPIHTVMAEPELRRLPYFRMIGVVGIDAASAGSVRGAIRGLSRRLAERPDSVVAFFPQGRIWPSFRRPLGFRRGVELFARGLPVAVLPVAIHLEPLTHSAPTVFVSVGEPLAGAPDAAALERLVEAELDRILGFLSTHGEAAATIWPAATARLPAAPAPAAAGG